MSITHIEMPVSGMSCNHCTQTVKKAVEKLEGVERVEVNLEKARAYIQGENLDPDNISKTIEELGYQPGSVEIKPDSNA